MPDNRRASRLTEALLIFLVCVVLFIGTLSVVAAKSKSLPTEPPLNLNTATRVELAKLLPEAASKIIAARPFQDVDALARQKLVAPERLRPLEDDLAVRTFADFTQSLWIAAGALAAFLIIGHLVLRGMRPEADPYLLPTAGMLAVLGVLLLAAHKDPIRDGFSFMSQTWGVVAGGSVALILAQLKPLWNAPLHRYSYHYALGAAGLVALVAVAGRGPGGVKLTVGGVFQPVEVAKVLMVFFLAAYLADRGPLLAEAKRAVPRKQDILPLLALYALPLSIFALLKDLGPALVLFGLFLALVWAAAGRVTYVLAGVLTVLLGGWLGYLANFGVFRGRVGMVLSPWDNMVKGGDQLAQGLWGMASGSAWGSGLGLGGTHFIPRGGSDLIFASVGEELGLPGILLVLLCLTTLVVRGVRIALRSKTDFDRLLAAGLASLLGIQAIIIVAGNLGLFPLTGITLPLVAYGKSSLITSFFVVGLLFALSARTKSSIEPDAPYPKTLPRLAFTLALLLLPLPLLRCLWIQGIKADEIALLRSKAVDADLVQRPHTNPRLLSLAKQVNRGRLLDRNGVILADTLNGKRVYPQGEALAPLVGTLDPRKGGPLGLEETFQWKLRGFSGPDALLDLWRCKDLPGFALPEGQDVKTSIDSELQKAAVAALQGKKGAVAFIEPDTGEVLAVASMPSGGTTGFDRATQGSYPPGSTFKVVTAAALLRENKEFTKSLGHSITGLSWKVDNKRYGRARINDDEEGGGTRSVNLTEAIAHSSNVYFALAGIAIGPEGFQSVLTEFGFSKVPSREKLAPGLAESGFGQGAILASPLEMAVASGTIAAGGRRFAPTYEHRANAKPAATPLTTEQAERIAEGMRAVVTRGTAQRVDFPRTTWGKTGTAQVGGGKKPHSWFIGYAKDPNVAFAVIVENGGYGARAAAPIASRLLR